MKTEKSNCKFCTTKFVLKRSDQKFCSNKCRSRYFNKHDIQNSEIVIRTNKILLKDYKILTKYLGKRKEVKVQGGMLRERGFSFEGCTSRETMKGSDNPPPVLYDLCYYRIDGINFKIQKV
jgi:hypothetical protein